MINDFKIVNSINGHLFINIGLANFEGIIYISNFSKFEDFLLRSSVIKKEEINDLLLDIMGFTKFEGIIYVTDAYALMKFFNNKVNGKTSYGLEDVIEDEHSLFRSTFQKLKNIIEK